MTFAKVWMLAVALAAAATSFVPSTLAEVNAVPEDFQRDRYFTPGFIFGASASAHQTEGARDVKGKGKSIWDHFSETYPERVHDAKEAIDFYHRYEEDIKLMKEMGIKAFRFSISWPRLLPNGKRAKGVNEDGVIFYNSVINKLLEHNIEPWVTIFHWDVPYALEEEYGGFRSKRIVEDFKYFAQLCFELFGDRVKRWMTINEPWVLSVLGYGLGKHAPGRCSSCASKFNAACSKKTSGVDGDGGTEPYIVTHNLLLAHAAAVHEYRKNFKEVQMGQIGLSLCSNWFLPEDGTPSAKNAVKLSLDWSYGWHLSPLTYGKYPDSMRKALGTRLPEFSEEEKYQLIRSFDFIGLNYYGSAYAVHTPDIYNRDCLLISNDYSVTWKHKLPGPYDNPAGLGEHWNGMFATYPQGLRKLLKYTMEEYENPAIYITENGVTDKDPASSHFHKDHIWQMRKAIVEDWVNVKGYFVWSLMDSYEWSSGYDPKMGLVEVDRENNLKRKIKPTGQWYQSFLLGKVTPTPVQSHDGGEL